MLFTEKTLTLVEGGEEGDYGWYDGGEFHGQRGRCPGGGGERKCSRVECCFLTGRRASVSLESPKKIIFETFLNLALERNIFFDF